jgi:hypothetical protein
MKLSCRAYLIMIAQDDTLRLARAEQINRTILMAAVMRRSTDTCTHCNATKNTNLTASCCLRRHFLTALLLNFSCLLCVSLSFLLVIFFYHAFLLLVLILVAAPVDVVAAVVVLVAVVIVVVCVCCCIVLFLLLLQY